MYLDLEWIFERLALEESFRVFTLDTHPVRKFSFEFLLRYIRPSDRILDLGCNRGEMSVFLAQHCKEVVGIEIKKDFVCEAKRRYVAPNLEFVCGDARHYLKRDADGFDVAIVSHLIEHLDDPRSLLESARQRCRQLYIEVPDFDRTYHNQYRLLLGSTLNYSDADHIWEFDRQELRSLVQDCGLEVVEEERRFGVIRLWCRSLQGEEAALTPRPAAHRGG